MIYLFALLFLIPIVNYYFAFVDKDENAKIRAIYLLMMEIILFADISLIAKFIN